MAFTQDDVLGRQYSTFDKYSEQISNLPDHAPLTRRDLLVPAFCREAKRDLKVYYAPFDYINEQAKVVLVGITPGFTQMELAFRTARQALTDSSSPEVALRNAKNAASFGGSMRSHLTNMLDGIGLPQALGIASSLALFDQHSALVHTTSLLRYPVFRRDDNYRGPARHVLGSSLLMGYVRTLLHEDLSCTGGALVIPLGTCVSEVLQASMDTLGLDPERCLFGFPHLSGGNGHRTSHYAERKDELARKVEHWFQAQI